jgi:hypothetical protein
MPGLLRGVARVGVAAGTATAVSNRVSRRQESRWAQQGPSEPEESYAQDPAPAPAPAAAAPDALAQLKELGALRDQGVLTESEFQTQKARILA